MATPITRRTVLQQGGLLVAGSTLAGLASSVAGEAKSRVVLIRDPKAVDGDGTINARVVAEMLDAAVARLLDEQDPLAAWKRIILPTDTVGVKSNEWRHLPTPAGLETAIRARLEDAGVKAERIAVADRAVLKNPVFSAATALINVRPLRTHHWSGLGTLIKNYVMFVPDPWSYHANACEPLGAIWHLPHVKGKTRLNILVMLTPQFHSTGPHHFSRTYVWSYGGLLVSRDPVAADAVGAAIIQARRRQYFGEERPIAPPPHHIRFADATYGLGTSSLERIELVRLGWGENALI
ncbi:MAG: DUF362 domain-containing protein [Acidobacteriota bacterium]